MKKNPYAALERKLGYRFKRKARLEQAFVHPSFAHEQQPPIPDNQRLEYLGDAALGLAAAEHLYRSNPDADEGDLTRMRSVLANTQTLHHLALQIGIGPYLRLGRGESMTGGASRSGNLADTLEAILGAAYLDGGLPAVQKIFRKHFAGLRALQPQPHTVHNPKGALQEHLQSLRQQRPDYHVLEESGPPHAREYFVAVACGERVLGRGRGRSKRTAETAAAVDALAVLASNPDLALRG